MIERMRVDGRVFEDFKFVGFGCFDGDGFLIIVEEKGGKYYAISLTGRVYNVTVENTQLQVEIPYGGGRVYRAPLRFKL